MSIGSEKLVMGEISQESNIPITRTGTNEDIPFPQLGLPFNDLKTRRGRLCVSFSCLIRLTVSQSGVLGVFYFSKLIVAETLRMYIGSWQYLAKLCQT